MNWLLAIRPKTLTVALSPIIIGTSLAYRDGAFHGFYLFLTILSALLIQIGTNLANDYFDFQKGADNHERKGPVRVTQAGLISPKKVKAAFCLAFLLASCAGLGLVYRGGWPIFLIGIASVLSGLLYTAGPYALAYLGLGELFVLIFFGPVAVAGTYYVQTLKLSWESIASGIAVGLLACAILVVNNLRDIETDRKANKKTLAVRLGRQFANFEYVFCLIAPAMIAFWQHAWFASGAIIVGLFWMRKSNFDKLLSQTALLVLVFSIACGLDFYK